MNNAWPNTTYAIPAEVITGRVKINRSKTWHNPVKWESTVVVIT